MKLVDRLERSLKIAGYFCALLNFFAAFEGADDGAILQPFVSLGIGLFVLYQAINFRLRR